MTEHEGAAGGDSAPTPPKWSLIERNVRRVTGEKDKQSEDFLLAAAMLASAVVGPGADKIARWSGYPRARMRSIAHLLRTNGVWVGRKVSCGDWWGKDGGLDFNLDLAVAKGLLERVAPPPAPSTPEEK